MGTMLYLKSYSELFTYLNKECFLSICSKFLNISILKYSITYLLGVVKLVF